MRVEVKPITNAVPGYLQLRQDLGPVEQQPGRPLVLVEEVARARHPGRGQQVALWVGGWVGLD